MTTTFLKVQKLSAALRTCSAFTTWLEDEIDVGVAQLAGSDGYKGLHDIHNVDLAGSRVWAFQAYQDYAGLDALSYSLDVYLQYSTQGVFSQLSGSAMAQTSPAEGAAEESPASTEEPVAMLETEAATQSKTQFWGAALAAPFVLGGDVGTWLAMYTGYQKYAVYVAASSGYQAAVFRERSSRAPAHSGKMREMYTGAAKAAWAQFSAFSKQAAYVDYILALWTMYALFIQPHMMQQQQQH